MIPVRPQSGFSVVPEQAFPVFESTRPISGLSPASMSYPSRSPDFGSSRPMATHMRTSNPSRTRFAVAVLTPIARTGTARNIGRMAPFAISRYLHSGSAPTAF